MEKIYHSIEELVGNTPLVELERLQKEEGCRARLLAKIEAFNPAGSVKDRAAKAMLDDAEKRGIITKETVIIEPTSGNTGVGLAAIGAVRGYRVIIVMPDTMSMERRALVKAYGAELLLTDGKKGMKGAIEKATELSKEMENTFIPSQFNNPANPQIHYETTGPEIMRDTDGKVDILVAGVGSGGSITGVGRYLKEQNPLIHIVAVEPENSPVLSGGKAGSHKIQGIGAGFIPKVLDTKIYDEVICVKQEEAFEISRKIARLEGILAGISSGAALAAAMKLAKKEENAGKQIVILLPDTGERYLTTELFTE